MRLLRLITAVPSLQRVVGGLLGALPGMGSILLLIALVFYVSAVMAVNLYGKEFPDLFGTLGTSLYTLFTIMTLEGWTNDVVNPIRKVHPYALFFFIPFIIITTFWVLNLFDETYYTGMALAGPAGTGVTLGLLGPPRTLGLSLQLRY